MRGFNGCILAYGQTSSGKTSLMRGLLGANGSGGLIAMCVRALLDNFEVDDEDSSHGRWKLKLSYLEIYNETIGCLLSQKSNLSLAGGGKDGGGGHGARRRRINLHPLAARPDAPGRGRVRARGPERAANGAVRVHRGVQHVPRRRGGHAGVLEHKSRGLVLLARLLEGW